MAHIQIIDVICNTTAYGQKQFFLLLDRMPNLIYKRDGHRFTACDSGFYDFLSGSSGNGDAFGGRSFDINLDDGSVFRCEGNVWSVGSPENCEPVVQVGVATMEKLKTCYVFSSASVSRALLEDWLSSNRASLNYYKYEDKERYWYPVRVVSKRRARALRKRGVDVRPHDGKFAWSPYGEKLKAKRHALDERDQSVKVGEVTL